MPRHFSHDIEFATERTVLLRLMKIKMGNTRILVFDTLHDSKLPNHAVTRFRTGPKRRTTQHESGTIDAVGIVNQIGQIRAATGKLANFWHTTQPGDTLL